MFALISTLFITWIIMWMFFRFMYPKPPKAFFPQAGDVTILRRCDYCGHELAQYRGIVENKIQQQVPDLQNSPAHRSVDTSEMATTENTSIESVKKPIVASSFTDTISQDEWFFCNAEHQVSFHAKETYQP